VARTQASSWGRAGGWLLGLLLGCLTAAAQAQDDPPGRVGRIAALQGEVWLYDDEQGEWQAAQLNRPLTQGDRLSTAANARAELRIGSTTLHLGGLAEVDVVRLDDERMQFALLRGSLGLRVTSSEVAAELDVVTPEGRFLPQRSGLYRIDRQDEISFGAVWRGELQFQSSDLSRTLQPGQRAEFWRDGQQGITRSEALAPLDDEFAQAMLRDDQAAARAAAPVYVSPEMTGAEELERYGVWQQHPEYGAVWLPAQVSAGWVPYRYGQWIWRMPWGWTWVDDTPWGFAPFHYGRWLWWGNRWCWAPGARVARPVYAPALVSWVSPQFSVWSGSRQVPAVGWVPLAPREAYRPGYRASPIYLNRLNAPGPAPAAGSGNRGIPGAVTVLPAPRLVPRQPVANAALRADEMQWQRPWQAERFHSDPPGRPAYVGREFVRPRASVPMPASPANPAELHPAQPSQPVRPTRPLPPPQAQSTAPLQPTAPTQGLRPAAPPPQAAMPHQAVQPLPNPQAAAPAAAPQAARMPPTQPPPRPKPPAAPAAPVEQGAFGGPPRHAARERSGAPAAPQAAVTAAPLPPPAAPAAAAPPAPKAAASPMPPRPTEAARAEGRDDDPGTRRRPPEMRNPQREK
jgi:hypothetical protein